MTPRVDPLVVDLVAGSKTPDEGIKSAMLKALYEVVSKAGKNISEASRASIIALVDGEEEQDCEYDIECQLEANFVKMTCRLRTHG
jgi:hypothetical protein